MLDPVDINEKWCYLSQKVTSFIMVPGEIPPLHLCKHKSHIKKAMCLTAMACPRQDPTTGVWWNGKIGTWFFAKQVPAKGTSKNRVAGTLETKSVSVGQKETEDMILDNLFPAILGKWPAWEQRRVRIQLDNTHCPIRSLESWAKELLIVSPSTTLPVGTLILLCSRPTCRT